MKTFNIFLLSNIMYFAAFAQTTQPILTLNTEMHSATINKISTDKQGKFILTCSKDKTAKLWNANTGELVRTFHVPIDGGDKGMLYSCALSPDGMVTAVGGFTYLDVSGNNNIYIFNTQTGEMIKRLSGIEEVIIDLEFSPDGHYLAAAIGGDYGIRIFNTTTWSLEKSLTGYGRESDDIAFDYQGRLASVCLDGKIRLYDSSFRLITQKETTGGKQPVSLCFSPDGSKIAVTYNDSIRLQVLNANDLSLLYEPDISGMLTKITRFYGITFSYDGQYLCAGGNYMTLKHFKWWCPIRCWDNAGRGAYRDLIACKNAVLDIKPMPDNSIIYCGYLPDFGRINDPLGYSFYKTPEINNCMSAHSSFLKVNQEGTVIGFKPLFKPSLTFSVNNSELNEKRCHEPSFKDHYGGLIVSDWKLSNTPKLNGEILSVLQQNERCWSVDIANDKKSVVLGADLTLYCLDADGNERWSTSTPSAASAVKISGNGKLLIAALANGLIEWYRMKDGKKLLSLFAHPDNKRWILWTPSGYYKCSTGAEDFIGWHVNNGADKEADYYTVSKFRRIYYRPDVIGKILETMDENESVRLANIEGKRNSQPAEIKRFLPPSITIISPWNETPFSTPHVKIKYRISSPVNSPVTGIEARIDGHFSDSIQGFKADGGIEEVTLNIPPQDCKVSLLAKNKNNSGESSEIALTWSGEKTESIKKPVLYILAIGISDYDQPDLKLNFAAKDATDFTDAMQKQKGGLYENVVVRLMKDKNALKDSILDGLDWLQRKTTSHDYAIIYLGGHGLNDNYGTFYFMPVGANPEKISITGLICNEIQEKVLKVRGNILVFVDACHSGNIMGGQKSPDMDRLSNELTEAKAIVFSSSTRDQYSLEDRSWGNGAFTKALVEGINGKAPSYNKKDITVFMLAGYISERVKELTKGKQSPVYQSGGITSFTVAVVKP